MADALELIGKHLGKYEITGYIGAGGMAFVYRGRQLATAFSREVAIKVISIAEAKRRSDEKAFDDFAKRFAREADIVSRLNHPHILKVFDYGEQDDLIYLVMELHTGGSLSKLLQENGVLSLEQASQLLQQIGGALDYAHNRGVIHRDLKPQNVLMDEGGNAILTDFGIAKLVMDDKSLTQLGATIGTPPYMSPEQWQGAPIDGRTDQYALGVMTFEMLTGALPFPGDTPYVLMHKHIYTPPPPIRDLRAEVPPAVEFVVNKALEKDREQRFVSATQFSDAFKIAITGELPARLLSGTAEADPSKVTPMKPSFKTTQPGRPTKVDNKTDVEDATVKIGTEEMNRQAILAKGRQRMGIVALGVVGVLIVAAVLLLGMGKDGFLTAMLASATPTQTNTPTATATPTITPTPSVTPSPTPLPVPPYLSLLYSKDFEDDTLDDIDRWGGGWSKQADPDDASNMVFCTKTGEMQWEQWSIVGSDPWTDYSVELRLQIVDYNQADDLAGNAQIAIRIQPRPGGQGDPDSYYVFLDALHRNTAIQRYTPSNPVELAASTKVIAAAQWYWIRLEAQGDNIRLFVDGSLVQEVRDSTLPKGAVGVQAPPSTTVCVDDIAVRNLAQLPDSLASAKRGTVAHTFTLQITPNGDAIGKLDAGQDVYIVAESADKAWVLVRNDKTAIQGWLPVEAVTLAS